MADTSHEPVSPSDSAPLKRNASRQNRARGIPVLLLSILMSCNPVESDCVALDLSCSPDLMGAFAAVRLANAQILSYAPLPVLIRAQAVGPFAPSVARGKIVSCSAAPALPVGLTLNSADCSIAGTPSGGSSTTLHQISADLDLGYQVSVTVSIRVLGDFRYLFVTAGDYTGSLGGSAGSDALCNADAGRFPPASSFAAVLGAFNGLQRYACLGATPGCPGGGSLNWPLIPNMEYRRPDGTTIIGSTDVNRIIALPLVNPISSSGSAWSGMEGNWNTLGATSECTGWTGGGTGNQWNLADATSTNAGNVACGAALKLICAEL